MGRPRTPTSILEAKGAFKHNPDRGRARENEPVPAGPLGDPPERLPEEQKAVWHELASEIPEGVLTVADRQLMEIFCSLAARHRAGELLKASEYSLMIQILSRMGMTPADRSRIHAPSKKTQKQSDNFRLLAGGDRGA